ncbi:MAG: hypothetical protein BWY09_02919 [Candidatus Hydrogenedentes bacterium ADurb.Bin179]|nr:MAG: hypothetical protein BWY09_02919 [Candidatus Hydrogenedentes bacterium ADurb.Bin179]
MKLTKPEDSAYQMGWIGIRASKIGKASNILKADGWIKLGHADLNNRNAFSWVRPRRTKDQFTSMDWTKLANAGLVGVAAWFCDAQWKLNSALTDAQWQARAIIEAEFNSQWPTGRRN